MTEKITSPNDLNALREMFHEAVKKETVRILVCAGTGCQASGSLKIYETRGEHEN